MLQVVSRTRHSAAFEIVVLVGSQGALPVARDLLSGLPEDFPAAVVYVQHRAPAAWGMLEGVLRYHARMPVYEIAEGDRAQPGGIYVAPAHAQTTMGADRTFRLTDGRCLADPLIAGVARACGPAALAVILSGRLRDGASGLRRIKQAGGRGLIQAPETAAADAMPLAAMATGCYDFVLSPAQLQAALVTLVAVPGAAELLGVRTHPVAGVGAF
jgi:two-component system chemotaxis response regulator CheB